MVVDIRAKVLAALAWSAAGRFATQLISWIITILVIRILTPDDYGLITMAAVLISLLYAVNDLGMDAVLVQKPDLTQTDRQHIFGLVIAINVFLFGTLILVAPWIAGFYDEPRVTAIIQVLSFQFLFHCFDTLPQSRLERELAYKGRSIVEMVSALTGSLATVTLAFMDFGVWALVWGSLLTTAVRTIGLNLTARCLVWPRWSLAVIRRHFKFGSFVCCYRALYIVFAESDKIIGGKLLGKDALGYYAVASHIASLPIQKLGGILNSVAFPAFSQANQQHDDIGDYLLKATRIMGIVSIPMFLGISVISQELVLLLLGEKWAAVALPLQILALVMPLRMLSTIITSLFFGIGRPHINAQNYALAILVMPLLFYFSTDWGVVGLSVAWLIGFPSLFVLFVWRVCHAVGIKPIHYLEAIYRPLCNSVLMYGMVWLARPYVAGASGEMLHLAQLVVIGVGAYMAGVMLIDRTTFRELTALLRKTS